MNFSKSEAHDADDVRDTTQKLDSVDAAAILNSSHLDKIRKFEDKGSIEILELAIVAEGEERTSWFVWMLVAVCTISGLLFGKIIIIV